MRCPLPSSSSLRFLPPSFAPSLPSQGDGGPGCFDDTSINKDISKAQVFGWEVREELAHSNVIDSRQLLAVDQTAVFFYLTELTENEVIQASAQLHLLLPVCLLYTDRAAQHTP